MTQTHGLGAVTVQSAAGDCPRPGATFSQAWRTISWRQWAWATGIALLLLVAYIMGILKDVLGLGSGAAGLSGWHTPEIVTHVITGLMAAYFFLVAVRFTEFAVPSGRPLGRRLAAAAGVAIVATVALETTLISLLPSDAGWNQVPNISALIPKVAWAVANWSLAGGLAVAVYARFQSARRAREAFEAAEIERAMSSREVLAARLAATQARVEPQFLLGTLAQIEALFNRDVRSGDRMLEGLIEYLKAALPQLRSESSNLESEARLCERYLHIAALRMGSRLSFTTEVPSDLGDRAFPPMLLLPLVDDALRNGLEPLPLGGRIDIRACGDGNRLKIVVSHDGVAPADCPSRRELLTTLRERLAGLYGTGATLTLVAEAGGGVSAAIEVPNEAARDHR